MKEDAQLLAELAKLVDRYGQERFASLASLLKNPQGLHDLTATVEGALAVSRSSDRLKKRTDRKRVGAQILETLRNSETEKYELLVSFRDDFVARKVFPQFRHVLRFANENGVALGSAVSREKAIGPLLRFMTELPLPRVQTIVQEAVRAQSDDRTLASWSDVIMGTGMKSPSSETGGKALDPKDPTT